MEFLQIDASKFSIVKIENVNTLQYDKKAFAIKIDGKFIKHHKQNQFNEDKVDFLFRDEVLKTFDMTDNYVKTKFMDVSNYCPLNKKFISFKTKSTIEQKPLDYIIINFTNFWRYSGKVGLLVDVELKYKEKCIDDDIFLD